MARKRKGEGNGQTGEGQAEESPESRRQGKTQRKKKEGNAMMTWTDFDLDHFTRFDSFFARFACPSSLVSPSGQSTAQLSTAQHSQADQRVKKQDPQT